MFDRKKKEDDVAFAIEIVDAELKKARTSTDSLMDAATKEPNKDSAQTNTVSKNTPPPLSQLQNQGSASASSSSNSLEVGSAQTTGVDSQNFYEMGFQKMQLSLVPRESKLDPSLANGRLFKTFDDPLTYLGEGGFGIVYKGF